MNRPDSPPADAHPPYYFFFSYARRDWYNARRQANPYLRRFFRDLATEVADLAPCEEEEATFLDQERIRLGHHWELALAQALQVSRTLVAVYSTRYFESAFCGKEFEVFLERRRIQAGGAPGHERILPVLWVSREWLEGRDLPPVPVGHVQYTHGAYPPLYFERGLKLLSRSRRTVAYGTFVNRLAQEIIRRAEDDPLPPLPNVPVFDEVRSAFEHATVGGGTSPSSIRFVPLFEGNRGPAGLAEWRPFGYGEGSLATILEGLVDESFDYAVVPADDTVRRRLEAGSDGNAIWVVLAQPETVADGPGASLIGDLLSDPDRDLSVVVPLGPEPPDTWPGLDAVLSPENEPDPRVLTIPGPGSEFFQALLSHLQKRRQAIVNGAEVHSPARGGGSTGVPLVRGPGEAA